ncbi:MAG TPA: RNA polymerase sigma factor [Anaerolineae bacterium]
MDLSGEVRTHTVSERDENEADLIVRARQGDERAWEQLVRQHQEPVFRLAYLVLGTGDAAEAGDIAQESLIRAYLKLDQYDEERPFRPWLLSIAANLARNRRRSLGRYWAAVQRLWQASPEPVSTNRYEEREKAQALWMAVRRLRPAEQEIIYLRYFLDLSEAETATALEVAPGTVKSRTHRALKRLRLVIEREFPHLREDFE